MAVSVKWLGPFFIHSPIHPLQHYPTDEEAVQAINDLNGKTLINSIIHVEKFGGFWIVSIHQWFLK